jgi:hypothetical protein
MAAKSKKQVSAKAPAGTPKAKDASAPAIPLELEELVHRIEVLAKKIDGYVRFICQLAGQPGTSAEMKARGTITFYEKLIIAEQQLGRVHDELRLE